MNPYAFFVGCSRSGTTLLRRIGDAHPELAIVREQHWLPRYWEWRIGITPDGIVTQDLLDMLLADRRFSNLELSFERVAELVDTGPPKHYSRFVTEVFDLHGEARGKRLVGEKTPKYVRHLQTLNELWPHAKIVHLIRDGRDVALSVLDWNRAERNVGRFQTWDEDPVTTAALYWEWSVRLGREAGAVLGRDRYYELRYEALVADPELECRKLCEFLALAYDPAMLRFHEGRTRSKRGLSAKKSWQPVTAGLRSWREQMAPGNVARCEAAVGKLLDELGYARGAASGSREALARAARLRETFAADARSRRMAVPGAWESFAA
jgi:Sulfotransferase family